MHRTYRTHIVNFLESSWMFRITVFLFATEAIQLAITSRFPMAFDEAYHFTLIQFFSHHINPVITSQSPSSYDLGAIIQDPSFLYHYLLSFPYRVIELCTHSFVAQVIILRLINIAFAIGSLYYMRQILRHIQLPGILINSVILIFAFTPIVTPLSAQINYDNLLILATTIAIYVTIICVSKLRKGIIDSPRLLLLLLVCFIASLVKYAFLPIFLAIILIVCYELFIYRNVNHKKLAGALKKNFLETPQRLRIMLIIGTTIFGFLFIRLYGVNVIRYHNPVPQCNQILPIADCTQYYAWNIDYVDRQQKLAGKSPSQLSFRQYTSRWVDTIIMGIYGEILPLQGPNYISQNLYSSLALFFFITLIVTLFHLKQLIREHRELLLFGFIAIIYTFVLFARNYHDYKYLGFPVAIDGRYVIPILIYVYIWLAVGFSYMFKRKQSSIVMRAFSSIFIALVLITFLVYGGSIGYLTQIAPAYGNLLPYDSVKVMQQ